jgi:hypothetical protein
VQLVLHTSAGRLYGTHAAPVKVSLTFAQNASDRRLAQTTTSATHSYMSTPCQTLILITRDLSLGGHWVLLTSFTIHPPLCLPFTMTLFVTVARLVRSLVTNSNSSSWTLTFVPIAKQMLKYLTDSLCCYSASPGQKFSRESLASTITLKMF